MNWSIGKDPGKYVFFTFMYEIRIKSKKKQCLKYLQKVNPKSKHLFWFGLYKTNKTSEFNRIKVNE